MTARSRWLIEDSNTAASLLDQFRARFTLEPMQIRHETLTFFDDFEWHLWRKKQLLASNNQGLLIWIDKTITQLFEQEPSPVFAHDLNNTAFRETLLKATKGRRLFPMAELEVEFGHYAVRNKDLKKVCDLNMILTGYGTMVELTALRGYEKEYRQSLNIVLQHRPDELEQHIFHNSLHLLGIQASDYRAKPQYNLVPELDSCDATALIAQKTWSNVRANEEGIIRDWDSEFLHQYRVALRRMRALFGQMKQSIGQEESQWFKQQLGQLAKPTNRLRDLDVYLASEDAYLSMIPEAFRDGLRTLFKDLARERQQVQKSLAQSLRSSTYKGKIALIESRLALCPQSPTRKGHKPVGKIAAQRIVKRYNSICLEALEINSQTPDEQIHEIRLGCKKLRYLLEFFGELYPKKQIKPLIKSLKKLQNILGDFNDYSVQRESLEHYLAHHEVSQDTEAAINALNGVLFNKQKKARSHVQEQLDAFLKSEVRKSVESLLTVNANESEKTGSQHA